MESSHEYARKLQRIADALLFAPEVDLNCTMPVGAWFWSDKKKFLAAVRALGPGEKRYDNSDLEYVLEGTEFKLKIHRDAVCRKVQDEKWECKPLLSPQEEAQVGSPDFGKPEF